MDNGGQDLKLNPHVILFRFEGGGRGVLRLSGTGTEGATLRVHLERYMSVDVDLGIETQTALREIASAVSELSKLKEYTGRTEPDVMTCPLTAEATGIRFSGLPNRSCAIDRRNSGRQPTSAAQ